MNGDTSKYKRIKRSNVYVSHGGNFRAKTHDYLNTPHRRPGKHPRHEWAPRPELLGESFHNSCQSSQNCASAGRCSGKSDGTSSA